MEPNATTPIAASHTRLRIAITAGALIAVVLRITFPALFERIDSVSVALIVVAIIPWLSPIVSKISIPGLIETELRELKQEVQEAKDEVASASKIALRSQDIALLSGAERGLGATNRDGSVQSLVELAKDYAAVRGNMPSGPARTTAMDKLFGQMLQEAGRLERNWPQHNEALRSKEAGEQLGAIAYAFAFPESVDFSGLIESVEIAKQPFVQYWGLRAIQRAVDVGVEYSVKDVERLRILASAFRSGTDRFLIASSISRALDKKLAD
ncbi:hypothetical protein [Mesorhizobium sp. LjNodule214]|uniref:hypothetical protein n=1 Tax=Mesorhizobium sp. LjNodule214 TaxID=3342252 RepID=UPI003ECFF6AF